MTGLHNKGLHNKGLHGKGLHNPGGRWRRQRQVPALADSITALEQWFETPLGQQLLTAEQRILNQELSCMFGYHLLQLSVSRRITLYGDSRICHCVAVGAGEPAEGAKVGLYSALESLPLEDESVDVTLLHHVLEFSQNPHQVLKEACRVTIPRGYIIIFGFNPLSTLGVIRPFARWFSRSPIWQRDSLSPSRISDWLQLLDCNTLRAHGGLYNLPLQNARYLKSCAGFNRIMESWALPFGNFYCLIARKDRVCMTPIRPDWSRQPRFRVPVKPALSARSAARLALIKNPKPVHPADG